jgi:NTE family protein
MRLALALGGGGARGYAHIGVIDVLLDHGHEVVGVAGTSMGALVGGLFAAGRLDAYTEWVRTIGPRELIALMDPLLRGSGAIRAEKVMARVGELLGGARIEDLPIPFTAVATDLLARRPVWFQRGPVEVAVRASVALPPAITPVVLNGRLLSDGGLMDPVPVAATTSMQAEAVVAVSLNGARGRGEPAMPVRESADARPVEEWLDRFRQRATALLARHPEDDAADVETDPGYGPLPRGLSKSDVVNLSFEAVEELLTRYRLAGYSPDLLVEIPTDACRTWDFHRAAEMIDLGRQAAVKALDGGTLG